MRCDQGFWFWTGVGNAPLDWAYNTAYNQGPGRSNCVFTVAPRYLPVFDSPFDDLSVPALTGFDFARPPYNTLDVTAFGQPGSKTATLVDYHGRDKSSPNYVSDHAGYDWPVKYVPLRAVAAGTVVRAETYHKIDGTSCDAPETHVYLQHTVCGVNGYCEKFVSYYTHMSLLLVSTGQAVNKGALIGFSGNSGCVSPHLHYTAARLTNTANNLEEKLVFTDCGADTQGQKINVASNVFDFAIDPYGWEPTNGPDPWGWGWKTTRKSPCTSVVTPVGAMSIWLWNFFKMPSPGSGERRTPLLKRY